MDVRTLLRTYLDFQRRWTEAAVSVHRMPWGVITRADGFPLIHMANLARVDAVPPGGPEEILEDMESAYAASPIRFRSLIFESADEAFAVQREFADLGFRPTAALAMARVGLPSCIVNPEVTIREAREGRAYAEFQAIDRAIHTEAGEPPEVDRQLQALDRSRRDQVGAREHVAYLAGEPAGTFGLWPSGRFAIVDSVATHPAFRGRGVARTMLFEACQLAIGHGCEYILLGADYFDTPQAMYKTLGFEPIGEVRGFLKT